MSTMILQYMIPSRAMSSGQYGTYLVTSCCMWETFKTTSVAVYFNCDKRAIPGPADGIQVGTYPVIGELDDNEYLENITDIPQEYKYKMDIVNTAKEEDIVKIISICFEDIASNIGSTTPAVLMLRSITEDENKDNTNSYLAHLWRGKELVKEVLSINKEIEVKKSYI